MLTKMRWARPLYDCGAAIVPMRASDPVAAAAIE